MGTTAERLGEVYNLLIEHTYDTLNKRSIPGDTVFGMGLYCLGLLQELLRVGNCYSISAEQLYGQLSSATSPWLTCEKRRCRTLAIV